MRKAVSKSAMSHMGSDRSRLAPQTSPKQAKWTRLTPQGERVKARFIAGDSIRKIAREEQISREKVTHIVRSEDVQAYIREMREMFFGLGHLALAAVQHALEDQKDARLAYQLLGDIGVIPSVAERASMAAQSANRENDQDTEEARVKAIMGRLLNIAFNQAAVFQTPIGDQMEARLKEAGGKFNPKTGSVEPIEKDK